MPLAPIALTIAGLDPSGGAGLLADVRTFTAFGLNAMGAVTSLTFQNEREFFGAVHQTGAIVRSQVESLTARHSIACAKTGMLPTAQVVRAVARLFHELNLPAPVVDPVIVSSSGQQLIEADAIKVLTSELFPICRLATPNIPEAETLTGMKITSEADMHDAAAQIRGLGARAVLVKGGHLTGELSVDVLDDGGQVKVFRAERIHGVELHGTGCRLSAAIAAGLGNGMSLVKAVDDAKRFVAEQLRRQVREDL
ncbi:MAG TPA: bifunctional hydroxymethylpyrimidine kinase/phosphomethylpyrimidine kinase [Pyrinomonadaceae bacterium]|nr:bifunctional hydroxymethylpyrimidine kinase/phosphomethylpyrimidine kinase [Pyrinomonadaceae bacterium]